MDPETNPSVEDRLRAANKRLDEEALPGIKAYIEQQGLEDASVVNRFVIQKSPNSYLVQTNAGVQEVILDSEKGSFSIKSSDIEPWLEEDLVSKKIRELSGGSSGVVISNAKVGSMSIGSVDVGAGSKGVEIEGLGIDKVNKFTFDVHGEKVEATVTPNKELHFEVLL